VNKELKTDVSYDLVSTSCTYRACTNTNYVTNQAVKSTGQLTNVMLLQGSVDVRQIAGYQVAQHSLVGLHSTHHHRLTISLFVSLSVCAILQPLLLHLKKIKKKIFIAMQPFKVEMIQDNTKLQNTKQHELLLSLTLT